MTTTENNNPTLHTCTKPQKPVTRWTQIPELTDSDTLEHLLRIHSTINNVSVHLKCTRYQVMNAMKAHGIGRQRFVMSEDMQKKLRI